MRYSHLIFAVILASSGFARETDLRVQEGRPIVNGVYVNGHGPYRFLVDTGANLNLIDEGLARTIGLTATSQVELASATGKELVSESDTNEILLGSTAKADGQRILLSDLKAIHKFSADIQGVLGQSFLSQFDYTIDLRGKSLEFGKQERTGTRVSFKMINGRLAVPTSLGELVLDSGAARLTLFGVQPDEASPEGHELQTVTGVQPVGMVPVKLAMEGRTIWHGDAVAIPDRAEPDVDGLLPLNLFKQVYVCNSEGYAILD